MPICTVCAMTSNGFTLKGTVAEIRRHTESDSFDLLALSLGTSKALSVCLSVRSVESRHCQ